MEEEIQRINVEKLLTQLIHGLKNIIMHYALLDQ
jgi:hypothetical protein